MKGNFNLLNKNKNYDIISILFFLKSDTK